MTHKIKVKEDTHLIREESLEQISKTPLPDTKPSLCALQFHLTLLENSCPKLPYKKGMRLKSSNLGILLQIPELCNHQ